MTCKEAVERVLAEHPETRDDSRLLLLWVWNEFGYPVSPEQWSLASTMPQVESVRRTRAKIQNEEKRYTSVNRQIKWKGN